MAQISTAISDLVLAITSLRCINELQHKSYNSLYHFLSDIPSISFKYATLSFTLVLVASSLGIFRFGLSSPPEKLVKAHKWFSWLATVIGVPALACEFIKLYSNEKYVTLLLMLSMITVLTWNFMSSKAQEIASLLLSGISLVVIGLLSVKYSKDWNALIGAILVAISGIIVGEKRNFLKLPAVDWFHYIFSIAIFCLQKSLR